MLKFTYQDKNQELKAWVDPENGSLNFQIGQEVVEIPHEMGLEMIYVLKQKQSTFKEVERKKLSSWNRFLEMATGPGKGGFWGTSWSEI